MNDEQVVRGLLADQVAAMKAGDAVALAGRFTADAVAFDLAPPLVHGPDEVRDPAGLVAWSRRSTGRWTSRCGTWW